MLNSTGAFCPLCQQEKSVSDFYLHKNGTQRYKPCKKCYQASRKKYYQEYGKKNRAKKKEYLASYYAANKEKYNEKAKEYRVQNAEKCAEQAKRYYKANQKECNERINAYIHRKRAVRFGAKIIESGITLSSIIAKKGNICYLCGEPIDLAKQFPDQMAATMEHKKPLCKGGNHSFKNVFVVHAKCNWKKGCKEVGA